jgi:hypothetical protein
MNISFKVLFLSCDISKVRAPQMERVLKWNPTSWAQGPEIDC